MLHLPTIGPVHFLFRTALLILAAVACVALALTAKTYSQADAIWEGILITFPILGLVTLGDFYLQRGYRVSYTDEAVYWRKVGLSRNRKLEVVMPFSSIDRIMAHAGTIGIRPFQDAILQSDDENVEDVILSRLYLRECDMREILAIASAKSNATVDEEINAFIT